jgi:hypothetical protein
MFLMLISRMNVGLDFRNIIEKIVFIIIMHVVIPIALKMLDRLIAHCKIILLRALPFFAAYIRMGVTHFTLLFLLTDVLALGQVADPL